MTRFAELGSRPRRRALRRTYHRPRLPLNDSDTQAQELAAIWNGVRDELRGTLPPSAFENWLEPLRAVGMQGSRLYVSGPDRVRDWFKRRYGAAATDALRRRAPGFTEIAFTDLPAGAGATATDDYPPEPSIPAGLADGLDFDRFVIGSLSLIHI